MGVILYYYNSPKISVQVLPNQAASQVLDDKGKVISTGKKMDRIRINAFPEQGGRFDFAGFIETADTPWYHRFFEKLFFNPFRFDGVVDGKNVDVWVRTESIRKRLGIGEKELKETAKYLSISRDFTRIWKRDTMNTVFMKPYYDAIREAHDPNEAAENVFCLLQPRLEWIKERERNPLSERHQLSEEEREAIQGFARENWPAFMRELEKLGKAGIPKHKQLQSRLSENLKKQAKLQRSLRSVQQEHRALINRKKAIFSEKTDIKNSPLNNFKEEREIDESLAKIQKKRSKLEEQIQALRQEQFDLSEQEMDAVPTSEISKKKSGLSYDLIVTAYPSVLGERSEMRLLVVLDKTCEIEKKELYPVIDFYHPEERLFIVQESRGGVAVHERAMRGWIRHFPLVSQPIATFAKMRDLYSVDRELTRIQEEYPVIDDASCQFMGDLICHVEAMHQEGVLLGAFNPMIYIEEQGEISRGALLGLEYATTPAQREADPALETVNWGNPLYFAPEVAKEEYERQTTQPSREPLNHPLNEASDMWVLGLRLMNRLQNADEEPCAALNAVIRRMLGDEPSSDLDRLKQIGLLKEGGILQEPQDKHSMEYLAYLMLKFNPAKRITAREALRRYYGMRIFQTVEDLNAYFKKYSFTTPPEKWGKVSKSLQNAMNRHLLGHDMRSDHLSQDEIRRLIKDVRPFAEKEEHSQDFNLILFCLNQLFSHPSTQT